MSGIARESKKSFRIWWMLNGRQEFGTLKKVNGFDRKRALLEAQNREVYGFSPSGPDVPLSLLIDKFQEGKTPATIQCSRQMKKWFLDFLDDTGKAKTMRIFTSGLINDFSAWAVTKGRSKNTLNRDIRYLCQIGEKALKEKIIREFDRREVKAFPEFEVHKDRRRPPPNILTLLEKQKILREFKDEEKYYYCFAYFVMGRGWRSDDIRSMRWDGIDWDNKIINFFRSKTGPKTQYLTDEEIIVLNEHQILIRKMELFSPKGYVYPARRSPSLRMCKNAFRDVFQQVCKNLKLRDNVQLNPHDARHSAATLLHQQGFSDEQIMQVTGHKDVKTLKRYYIHLNREDFEKARRAIKL